MEGVDHLRQDLAFVDRMIAECRYHITRLQKTTAEMSREGQDIELANDVLANFTAALTRYGAERKRVMSAIKKAPRRARAPAAARRGTKSLVE